MVVIHPQHRHGNPSSPFVPDRSHAALDRNHACSKRLSTHPYCCFRHLLHTRHVCLCAHSLPKILDQRSQSAHKTDLDRPSLPLSLSLSLTERSFFDAVRFFCISWSPFLVPLFYISCPSFPVTIFYMGCSSFQSLSCTLVAVLFQAVLPTLRAWVRIPWNAT